MIARTSQIDNSGVVGLLRIFKAFSVHASKSIHSVLQTLLVHI